MIRRFHDAHYQMSRVMGKETVTACANSKGSGEPAHQHSLENQCCSFLRVHHSQKWVGYLRKWSAQNFTITIWVLKKMIYLLIRRY